MIEGRYARTIKPLILTGDLLCVSFSFILAFYLRHFNAQSRFDSHEFLLLGICCISWVIISVQLRLYFIKRIERIDKVLIKLIKGIGFHFGIMVTFFFLLRFIQPSRIQIFFFYIILILSIVSWRIAFHLYLKYYRKLGNNFTNVVILGAGHWGHEIRDYLIGEQTFGYRFLGFFDDSPPLTVEHKELLGGLDSIQTFVCSHKVDEIFCANPNLPIEKIRDLIKFSENNFVRLYIIPDFYKIINKKVGITFYDDIPVVSIMNEPLERFTNRIIKRTFDVFFSILIIVLVFPWLLPLMTILIKFDTSGPIFFRQLRHGKNNREFKCIKFRSMRINSEADKIQARKNDVRITKLGAFIRKYNIDEMPQFVNVLLGDMTVVGPRPHMLKHTMEYSLLIEHYLVRQMVKPGITGWAQVNGFRGETTDPSLMNKRVRCDAWYIENWSILLDIQVIFLTIFNMAKGERNAG